MEKETEILIMYKKMFKIVEILLKIFIECKNINNRQNSSKILFSYSTVTIIIQSKKYLI